MIKGLVFNFLELTNVFYFNFSVVQELDDLKRNENGARNAIRWLEREFKEGTAKFLIIKTSKMGLLGL